MRTIGWGSLALLWIATAAVARGQQFRIETEVFSGEPPRLISRSLTLFDGPLVYDFLMIAGDSPPPSGSNATAVGGNAGATGRTDRNTQSPALPVEEVVIFDQQQQRLILLDQQRRHRLELTQAELLTMVAGMQANESLRAKDSFLLEPQLTEKFDPRSGQLELASERLVYRAQGQRVDDNQVLIRYFQFADWAARLNVTDSRKLPPFARLQLNQAMKKRGWIPHQVQIQLTTLDGQSVQASVTHHTLFHLSQNDQQRIASAQRQWSEFPAVNLIRYRGLNQPSLP